MDTILSIYKFKSRSKFFIKMFLKRVLKFFIDLIYCPFVIFFVFFIRIFVRVRKIRFVRLYSYSMGDFTISSELYLCDKLHDLKNKYFDIIFYENNKICNSFWNKIVNRNVRFRIPSSLGHKIIKICENRKWYEHVYYGYQNFGRDIDSYLKKYPIQLKLTEKEILKGKEFLRNIGLSENDKFICFNVRDSAFHNDKLDVYRDSNIDNYILLADTLANMGYYVFRMGSKVNKKLNTNHPKVFDYATNGMRTEFLDIFLGSECHFCISTGTGWDSVPALYRRPLVFVNLLPIAYYPTFFNNCIFQTKNHFSNKENRYLTLSEIFSKKISSFASIKEFDDNSIKLIENTPEEILAAGLEMLDLLNSNAYSQEEEQIQINFWKNFDLNLKSKAGLPLHGELNARHSLSFLKKYPHWLS